MCLIAHHLLTPSTSVPTPSPLPCVCVHACGCVLRTPTCGYACMPYCVTHAPTCARESAPGAVAIIRLVATMTGGSVAWMRVEVEGDACIHMRVYIQAHMHAKDLLAESGMCMRAWPACMCVHIAGGVLCRPVGHVVALCFPSGVLFMPSVAHMCGYGMRGENMYLFHKENA